MPVDNEASEASSSIEASAKNPPDRFISIDEVWLALGGNPGIQPTREELLAACRQLDAVCDLCDEAHAEARP